MQQSVTAMENRMQQLPDFLEQLFSRYARNGPAASDQALAPSMEYQSNRPIILHTVIDWQRNSTPHPPRVRPNETVNNSIPKNVKMTREDLLQSIGYVKPDKLLWNLHKLCRNNYSVSGLHWSPSINPGETASIRSNKKIRHHQTYQKILQMSYTWTSAMAPVLQ